MSGVTVWTYGKMIVLSVGRPCKNTLLRAESARAIARALLEHADALDPPDRPPTSSHPVEQTGPNAGERVRQFLLAKGPRSDSEIARFLGMTREAARTRRVELVRAGLVRHAVQTTFTRDGRRVKRWEAV